MTKFEIYSRAPLASLRSVLQAGLLIEESLQTAPSKVMMIGEFRALSLREKTELINLINRAASLHQYVLRLLMEDAIKNHPA